MANEIACTNKDKYITINDIVVKLKDGKKGVGGIGSYGKMIKI